VKKKAAQLDREIEDWLDKNPLKDSKRRRARAHELFYVSEDQQGGKHAEHFEQFNDLGEALDTLARLPAGSITYGNADEGPKFMIVWAAAKHTPLLYWTDGDLNVQGSIREETIQIREEQAKRTKGAQAYFDERFRREVARHW
jgi:hypothetical protein